MKKEKEEDVASYAGALIVKLGRYLHMLVR
jgi:hypothetical protein